MASFTRDVVLVGNVKCSQYYIGKLTQMWNRNEHEYHSLAALLNGLHGTKGYVTLRELGDFFGIGITVDHG